ncbi:MAG: glycosyltransferase [Pseudomonadota bacterium]|nr:glycosyltransferase [Pseudomonadota bacterium]
MKVIQLLPELNSGGVERGTLEIAKALVQQGHQSVVISNGGRMVKQLGAEGSQHITLPIHRKSLASLWQIRPLRRILREQHADLIHVRSRVPAWLTHFARCGMPVAQRPRLVSTVHGFYSVNRYSQIMTSGERVIAVSDSVVDYIHTHYPHCPPDRIVRIYRGIDPNAFPHGYRPPAAWWQCVYAAYPELEHKTWLTLAGRITRLKGHDTLIRLANSLLQHIPDLHIVIVGGADPKKQAYLDELSQLVQHLGLQAYVTFVGHRQDMREWLAASQLVLSLSTQAETFGRIVLEALAVGTAVIGWERGGVAEILSKLYPIGLVPAEATEQLQQRIQQLLQHPVRPDPVYDFTLAQMTTQEIQLYQQLISSFR